MTMTSARVQNLLIYCLLGLLNLLAIAVSAALAAGTMPGFREGEFLHPSQPAAIGLLIVLIPPLTSWLAAHQPSWGGEGLAAQANVYRADGIHRDDMIVLPRDQAAIAVAGNGGATAAFSDIQVQQLTDELLRRRGDAARAAADDERLAERHAATPDH